MEKQKDWENIYKTQGVVQNDILMTALKAVDKCISSNKKKVLDLGCGTGRHTIYLAQNNFDTFGCDISETGLKITASRLKEHSLMATLSICSCTNLNYPDNYFDAIICLWTSGHGLTTDVQKHISEMHRTVKPDGFVFCDFISTDDALYGKGTQIEPNTFINVEPSEADIPHHFSTQDELLKFYRIFTKTELSKVEYQVKDNRIKAFFIEATK